MDDIEVVEEDETPRCWFCGEEEELSIGDIWTDHNFTLTTCCQGLLESVAQQMHEDPRWGRELLRRLGAEEMTGHTLRKVCDDAGDTPMLSYKLDVREIAFADAKRFIARHHRHCNPPTAWRWGACLFNGWTKVGVVSVGNPAARGLMNRGIVEVNRLCVREDVAGILVSDACSKLYAWSAQEAERRGGFERIVTYTRVDESGASLRAVGWEREAIVRGRSWHGGKRARSNRNAHVDKVRWGKALHPKPVRAKAPHARIPPETPAAWMRQEAPGPCSPSAPFLTR